MAALDDLARSISARVADYKHGPVTPGLVTKWVGQFDAAVREPLLREFDHVLEAAYITRAQMERFLDKRIEDTNLTRGEDPAKFWKRVNFLDIQLGGSSPKDMLAIWGPLLKARLGFTPAECGQPDGLYFYLDDIIFTGSRVRNDLKAWIKTDAPQSGKLVVLAIAIHQGSWFAQKQVREAFAEAGKNFTIHWFACHWVEDRLKYINTSDVLRPTQLPKDPAVVAYANTLQQPIKYRDPGSVGDLKIFSSEEGRNLIEQEFLKGGVRVRKVCTNFRDFQRPLGFTNLSTFGFGGTLITYRNCPNNCPLVLWANAPWVPLLPRKNN